MPTVPATVVVVANNSATMTGTLVAHRRRRAVRIARSAVMGARYVAGASPTVRWPAVR